MTQIPTLNDDFGDAEISPPEVDVDEILQRRTEEVKEAARKAAKEDLGLTDEEEFKTIDLIHAGRMERTVDVFNRKIQLRTLTIEEELKLSDITKDYIGTDGYPRAYRTAVVAAAIRSIDKKLLYDPISDEEFENIIRLKYEKLLKYYPIAVDQIYARYREMELEILALVDKLGKFSG